jgi:DNA-directed RNA polymerase subunit H (RpoH/RPB5)
MLPEAKAYCWFDPLMFEVFNFLAILQIRRGNLEKARYYLKNIFEDNPSSVDSLVSICKEWLEECRNLGYHEFAANLLEEYSIDILSDPEVKLFLERLRNGKNPWPKFQELTEDLKIENFLKFLKEFVSMESQIKYINQLPLMFLSQVLYQSLSDTYVISNWVPAAVHLTKEEKELILSLDDIVKNPPSRINFLDPIPTEAIQINEDWIVITQKIRLIVNSLEARLLTT